jgi:hypothetical protein
MTCFCPKWFQSRPADGEDDSDESSARKKDVAAPLKGSVAHAISHIEKNRNSSTPKQRIERSKKRSPEPSSVAAVLAKASAILDRFRPSRLKDDEGRVLPKPRSFKPISSQNGGRRCRVCQKKLFPTEKITTAQKQDYHAACFKCALCGTKLKNHPDEDHNMLLVSKSSSDAALSIRDIVLKCHTCKIHNEQNYETRTHSTLAGQRVVIGDEEQGDIEQVVDLIGDELENAICGMTPRCSTCGGDFLTYKGEIAMMGALKYHKECFQMGKPALGVQTSAVQLPPRQAAKYLPDTLILRLSSGDKNGRNILSSLFFVWTNKDDQLRALRAKLNESVRVFFHLDEEARANPNHRNSSKKKRFADLPPGQDPEHPSLRVDIINEQIAPKSPGMVGRSSIVYSKKLSSSVLCAEVEYDMYSLRHLISLNVPCDSEQEGKLDLARASLTVDIHPMQGG